MPKCKIESVQTVSKTEHNPVIINFQNAVPLEEDNSVRFVKDTEKQEGLLIEYKGELNTTYYGKIGEGYPKDLISTCLAIRNKTTNKIRLVEVEECSVLSHHYYKDPNATDTRQIDAKSLLYKSFGSKSAIRAMDRLEKTAFNPDILKDQLEVAVNEVDENSLVEETTSSNDVCPKRNKDADKLEDVYKLEDIIPEEILVCLEEPALSLLETKLINLPFTSPFLLSCVKEIHTSKQPESPENVRKLKICLYLDGLVNLINSKTRLMTKIEISKLSQKLTHHIRDTFTHPDAKTKIKTKYTKQKALCHYLVLAFFLTTNFQLNVASLIEGLGISKNEILQYYSYVGAIYHTKVGAISLKLPKELESVVGGKPYRKYKKRQT